MGTRNLTCVWVDGDFKVAQYGQWDGYPSVAGAEIMSAIRDITVEGSLEAFADTVRGCRFLEEGELEARYAGLGIEGEWIPVDDADRFKEHYPQLDRDMGYHIVRWLWENGPAELNDSLGFAQDGLFCEWAYVVDLDERTLEVYCSGNGEQGWGRLGQVFDEAEVVPLLRTVPFDEIAACDIEGLAEEIEESERE